MAEPDELAPTRTVPGYRPLLVSQGFGYLAVAFLVLATLGGGAGAWVGSAIAIFVSSTGLVLYFRRRRAQAEDAKLHEQEGSAFEWERRSLRWRERPSYSMAVFMTGFCGIFAVTSTAAVIWLRGPWQVPVAYLTTSILAFVVVATKRIRRPVR